MKPNFYLLIFLIHLLSQISLFSKDIYIEQQVSYMRLVDSLILNLDSEKIDISGTDSSPQYVEYFKNEKLISFEIGYANIFTVFTIRFYINDCSIVASLEQYDYYNLDWDFEIEDIKRRFASSARECYIYGPDNLIGIAYSIDSLENKPRLLNANNFRLLNKKAIINENNSKVSTANDSLHTTQYFNQLQYSLKLLKCLGLDVEINHFVSKHDRVIVFTDNSSFMSISSETAISDLEFWVYNDKNELIISSLCCNVNEKFDISNTKYIEIFFINESENYIGQKLKMVFK